MCPISSKILVNIEGKRKEKKYKKVKKEEMRREEKAKVALLVVILATLGSMHLVVTLTKKIIQLDIFAPFRHVRRRFKMQT